MATRDPEVPTNLMEPEKITVIKFFSLLGKFIILYWKSIVAVVYPLVLLFIPLGSWAAPTFKEVDGKTIEINNASKFKCMYVFLLMAGFWLTEVVPCHITGFLPIFLFPLLNIMSSAQTCSCYFKEVNMMFVGSIFLAIAVEYCNLHNRIAIGTIMCIGTNPRRLHFTILTVTFFLSMWMMNAAVAAMMCPIIKAIIDTMENLGIGRFAHEQTQQEIEEEEAPRPTNSTIAYYIGVGYCASIGGVSTIIGTGTNLAYKGIFETRFDSEEELVGFVSWMLFGTPTALLVNCCTCMLLQFSFMGLLRPKSKDAVYVKSANEKKEIAYTAVREEMSKLGKMSWHEIWVACLFVTAVLFWIFRRPNFITGWADILTEDKKKAGKMMKDSVIAFAIVFAMMILPATAQCFYSFSKYPNKRPKKRSLGLIIWKVLNTKTSWGILFLIGGGFALAEAGKVSGMSEFIGEKLRVLENVNKYVVLCLTSFVTGIITQFASNMSTVNMFVPILFEIAVILQMNPIMLGHCTTIVASFAFMLPVATPTNAIVAGYANVAAKYYLKAGGLIFITAYLILLGMFCTYGRIFWDLTTFPDWAQNMTVTSDDSTTMQVITTAS